MTTAGDVGSAASTDVDMDGVLQELGLTPVLAKYSEALRGVTDDKLRYQQLLFLAAKCEGMPEAAKTDQNKVAGVLQPRCHRSFTPIRCLLTPLFPSLHSRCQAACRRCMCTRPWTTTAQCPSSATATGCSPRALWPCSSMASAATRLTRYPLRPSP